MGSGLTLRAGGILHRPIAHHPRLRFLLLSNKTRDSGTFVAA
jgi:hypothetical protein